jgi:[ribosomal protein S5]-alanine N-acetyltransferase
LHSDLLLRLGAPFESTKLSMETMGARHADAFFGPMQDDALYQWISMTKPPSLEWLRTRWLRNESRMSPDGQSAWLAWAVRRKVDGAYLGCVDADVNDNLEAINFGYFFFPPHWGQGYASEAVVAATQHLIDQGVHRLVATVTAGNHASARVLQKAGYTFNQLLVGNDVIRGVAMDDEEYVKTTR